MDLGIAGRKAIVCASSRGLGKACARTLAEAGCEVVINGRNAKTLEAAALEFSGFGVKIIPVVAGVASPGGEEGLLAAWPPGPTRPFAWSSSSMASPSGPRAPSPA